MSTTLIWAFVCLIIFVAVLAHPKASELDDIYLHGSRLFYWQKLWRQKIFMRCLNSSSLHLMIIICMFSGMIAATGLDIIIGDFVDHVTSSQTGKKERNDDLCDRVSGIRTDLYSPSEQLCSDWHSFRCLKSIARKNRISLSKLVLFVIFATTLGGAITLIGTPTNVYANTALEEAGLQLFGMLDFAWVGIPIFIVGGIYMIVMNRWCASYDDFGEADS